MGKVLKLIKAKSDVKDTLKEALKQANDMECVLILAIDQYGEVYQMCSSMTQKDMALITCAQNAIMQGWLASEE